MTPYSSEAIPRLQDHIKQNAFIREAEVQSSSSSETFEVVSEPAYGKRLIAQTVDDLAVSEPERIWATVTVGQDIDNGFRDFTTRQLANAVNNVAWWLDGKFGRSDNFEVLAYLGVSDVRYAVLFFAAVKCGYVVSTSNGRGLSRMSNSTSSSWCHQCEMQRPGSCTF